jgi:hypothetical protein
VRRLAAALVLVAGLAAAAPSAAAIVVKRDHEGRAIRFDARAPGVDVEWYARIVRVIAHGDEVEQATIRLVAWDEIPRECGAEAVACYRRRLGAPSLLVLPAGKGDTVAHALVHEYAHHLDREVDVPGLPEPSGTPAWAAAREIERRFGEGEVSSTYALGWERSIGEIFAEDYTQLHLKTQYEIPWLDPPDVGVLAALRSDLPTAPVTPIDLTGTPLVELRSGTLRRSRPFTLPFRLLGQGRRVTFTARVAEPGRAGVRARIELRCGSFTVTRPIGKGRAAVTLDARDLGPATCTIRLRGTVAKPLAFTARLRLALQPGAPAAG